MFQLKENIDSLVNDYSEFIKPLLGMASFGFGLALPFTLFAVIHLIAVS